MNPKKALYVDWSVPKKNRGDFTLYKKHWEIAMIVRSTHFSKSVNNLKNVLYCDIDVFEYYKKTGLDSCFDEIYPILPLDCDFSPSIFWAAGKFLAIQHVDESFIMIDLDAEIRFKLDLSGLDVLCSHVEDIYSNDLQFYPKANLLDTNGFLRKSLGLEWSDKAYNTSILYFRDVRVAKEYADKALDFIRNISVNPSYEKGYILMVEQRFLYEFSRYRSLSTGTLISGLYKPGDKSKKIPSLFVNSNIDEITNKGFLHIWGFKNNMSPLDESEKILFGQLISSVFDLRDKIVSSVAKNDEFYKPETSNQESTIDKYNLGHNGIDPQA